MKTMNTCICLELDNDVDDLIAYIYLQKKGFVDCVVLSPYPSTEQGKDRLKYITCPIYDEIPEDVDTVMIGGSLTAVNEYCKKHPNLPNLIANGGFVGNNIENTPLDKFGSKTHIRTFNFNIDVKATDELLRNPAGPVNFVLVGKNVCHSPENKVGGKWWKDDATLWEIREMNVCPTYKFDNKLQHDLFAFTQGLAYLNGEKTKVDFIEVYPDNKGLKNTMTEWGSSLTKGKYRKVKAAVFRKE